MSVECGTVRAYRRHLWAGETPCAPCRQANAEYHAGRRAARAQDPSAADQAGHGKGSTYRNYGCRCQPCTAANTAERQSKRAAR